MRRRRRRRRTNNYNNTTNTAAEFVRQSSKMNSIQYRISITVKSGPGGV
jgi:hypothetical protein